jgi:hypothetical protein
MNIDYEIKPPKTDKDKIKHPKLAEAGVIAKLGSSILLIGVTASGKTVLTYNLLHNKEFYGGAFDKLFYITPTPDDTLKGLNIPEECIFRDLKKASEALDILQKHQKEQIKKHGNHVAHQFGILMDDCISDSKFMKTSGVLQSFIANRHYNETVFLASQHLNSVPKVCRIQAKYVCIFECSAREMEVIAESFCPSGMTDKQFEVLMLDVWNSRPFQFLTIHRGVPLNQRYRQGLAQIIDLEYYKSLPPNGRRPPPMIEKRPLVIENQGEKRQKI